LYLSANWLRRPAYALVRLKLASPGSPTPWADDLRRGADDAHADRRGARITIRTARANETHSRGNEAGAPHADSAAIGTAANSLLRHAGVLPHRIVGAVNHVNAPHRVTVIVLRDRV
jgi:hypothetical protein